MEQVSHPLLFATLLVVLGDYVIRSGKDRPSYASDRVGDSLTSPCFQLRACLSTVLKDFKHVEPFGASLPLNFRVLSLTLVVDLNLNPAKCLRHLGTVNSQVIRLCHLL